jgi:hypothetical protein
VGGAPGPGGGQPRADNPGQTVAGSGQQGGPPCGRHLGDGFAGIAGDLVDGGSARKSLPIANQNSLLAALANRSWHGGDRWSPTRQRRLPQAAAWFIKKADR